MNINVPINFDFINNYVGKIPPWGEVGYITYKRTYARPLNGRTEEWWETVGRCVRGLIEIGGLFTQEEIEELYDHVFNLRCCFSGRALWQLGTSTVHKYGSDSLQNCWFVNVSDPESFAFTMNELMLGGGVGFSVQSEHVYKLPRVKQATIKLLDSNDVDFIVPDNREGWVELLRKTLKAYFINGKGFTYTTRCIRTKGKQIQSFGGVSSGPDELVKGIQDICKIFDKFRGECLNSVACLDIMNIIGRIVVAGNVRRSAELAIGDYTDLKYLRAKRWDLGNIPNWRAMSNNSIVTDTINDVPEEFWEGYHGNGEPYGLVNIHNARNFGRILDGLNYRPDFGVDGFNPCAEIALEDKESCNLSELYLPNIPDLETFKRVAGLMYKSCKTIAGWPFIDKKTNEVVTRNQRIGIGITGVYQSNFGTSAFSHVYGYLEAIDENYSRKIGRRQSVKLTTVKPSGTLSLLPGVTPGAHPAYSKFQIRRIRFSSNSPLLQKCIEAGYHAEEQINFDGTSDPSTIIVSFPVKYENATVAKDVTAIDQLNMLKKLQESWSDNAVSITVYYKPEELNAIRDWLEINYDDNLKSVSFLRHSEHGFKQAPLEEIGEEHYDMLKEKTKPIISITEDSIEETFNIDGCEGGGACPIR